MSVVRTRTPSGEAIVILTEAEYDRLLALAGGPEPSADTATGVAATLSDTERAALAAASTPLAFWRAKRGISPDDLARRAGISRGFLTEIEAGQRAADARTTERLAQALGLSPQDLART